MGRGSEHTFRFDEYYRLDPECRKQAITRFKNGWKRGLEAPLPQKSAHMNCSTFESPQPILILMADTERESASVATASSIRAFFSFSKYHNTWCGHPRHRMQQAGVSGCNWTQKRYLHLCRMSLDQARLSSC